MLGDVWKILVDTFLKSTDSVANRRPHDFDKKDAVLDRF